MGAIKWKCLLIACMLFLPLQGIAQRDEVSVIKKVFSRAGLLKHLKGISYVMVVPRDFLPELLPLARFRQQRHQVACVTLESICYSYPGSVEIAITRFLHDVRHGFAPKLKYLLLAADAKRIPPYNLRDYREKLYSTDYPYSRDQGKAPLLVGRLPAANAKELQIMVSKTLRYEKSAGGLWQRKISVVADEGGFGNVADALLEKIFTQLITSLLPGWSDLTISYANANSAYFYPAHLFPRIVARRLNEGSLFFVYIGHGNKDTLGTIRAKGYNYPIFNKSHLRMVKIPRGLPIVFSIACYTGYFAQAHSGLGQAMMKMEKGPVAFLGASQVSHPYGNILLGKALLEGAFAENKHTVGELLLYARQQLINPQPWDIRLLLLNQAIKYFAGNDLPLEQLRKDHVGMYNLFADPALRIAFPQVFEFYVGKTGATLLIKGQVPGKGNYRMIITLEMPVDKIIAEKFLPLDFSEKTKAEQAIFRANYKIIASKELTMNTKSFSVTFPLPLALPSGEYVIKVAILDSSGATVGYRIFNN